MLADNPQFKLVNDCHPHIGEKLKALWGTNKCNTYLNDLFDDSRDPPRKGFSPEVASALFKLMSEHEKAYPDAVAASSDIWSMHNKL